MQELDTEKDAAQRRLSEIEAVLGENEALKRARHALKTAQEQLKKWSKQQRELDLQIQSIANKRARSEKRLYSGEVTNPKELTDLQSEITSLQRRKRKLEDELLEAMIALEESENAQTQAQQHFDQTESQWLGQQANLKAEQQQLQSRLIEIQQARAKLPPQISTDKLAAYDTLRAKKSGLAVVKINGDACGGCGVSITPALKWELRQQEMAYCGNCGRIIVPV
ncbi:MAG TPA: hypothetical protein ENN19_11870 [Chloroflexi bacterium]|nr:hypothetical protein [Chloroflexota bacterium]